MKTNSPEQPSHFRPAHFQDPEEHPGNWDQRIWGRHPGLCSARQASSACSAPGCGLDFPPCLLTLTRHSFIQPSFHSTDIHRPCTTLQVAGAILGLTACILVGSGDRQQVNRHTLCQARLSVTEKNKAEQINK